MISLVLAGLLAAASAADAPAAEAPKAEKAAPKPTDMVCKREAVLGSRLKQRVCMTQADWDARKMQDRMDLEQSQGQKNPIPAR